MQVKFGHVMIVGVLFTLSGCGSSGGSFGGNSGNAQATPVVTPKKSTSTINDSLTQNQNTTAPAGTTATAFIANVNDGKALNITRVVRPTGELAKEVQEVVRLTNQLRAEKGLKPLIYDENLSAYAQVRAVEYEITKKRANSAPNREWGNKLAHQRIDGRSFSDGHTGFGGVSENLAPSRKNAMQAVKSWQESSGHYANMMNETHERMGVGVVYIPNSQYGYYWAQVFASGTASFPYEFVDMDGGNKNTQPLQKIIVDGRTIPVNSLSTGHWRAISNDSHQGWLSGYEHTRFGVMTPHDTTDTKLLYQGNQTADYAIPKSGKANYKGIALVVKDGQTDTNVKSEFTADFGKRKLNGALKQNTTTLYNISADINGSGFASKQGASVQTQGAFFGQNAEELAGVFKDTKSNTKGVFGAKK